MKQFLKCISKPPLWKKLLAFILFILGFYLLVNKETISFLPLVFSLMLVETRGTEIDVFNKKYRNLYSVLGLNIGTWKELPNIDYVSVFKNTIKTKVWVSSASSVINEEIITLNLFYDRNKKIKAFETYNQDEAFEIAKKMASALEIDILDATKRGNSKWLD